MCVRTRANIRIPLDAHACVYVHASPYLYVLRLLQFFFFYHRNLGDLDRALQD